MNNNFVAYGAQKLRNRLASRRYAIRVDTNNTCNLNCIYCRINDDAKRPEYLSPRRFEQLAELLFPRSRYVSLSFGTEPLMSRDFSLFLRKLGEYDVPETHFITNGLLLTDEIIQASIDSRLGAMTISNDAATSETYSHIRGKTAHKEFAKGAGFDLLMGKLKRIAELKRETGSSLPIVRIQFTLFSYNQDEAAPFIEQYHPYFQEFYLTHLSPMYLDTYRDERLKRISPQDFLLVKTRVADAASKHGIRIKTTFNDLTRRKSSSKWCPFPISNRFIHSNGNVMMCDKHIYGNIFLDDFNEIERRISQAFRRPNPNCRSKCTQPIAKEKEI